MHLLDHGKTLHSHIAIHANSAIPTSQQQYRMALINRLMMYKASQVYVNFIPAKQENIHVPHGVVSSFTVSNELVRTICGDLNIIVTISLYPPPAPFPPMSWYVSKKKSKCHAAKFIVGLMS